MSAALGKDLVSSGHHILTQLAEAQEQPLKGTKRKLEEDQGKVDAVAKRIKAEDAGAQPEKSTSLPPKVKHKCSCGLEDTAPSLPQDNVPEFVPVIDGKPAYKTSLEKAFESLPHGCALRILNTTYGSIFESTKEKFLTQLLPLLKKQESSPIAPVQASPSPAM
jgi:hypothetical protein